MSREKNTGIAPDIAMSAPFPGQLASGTRPERDRHGDPRGSCAPAARKNTAMSDERHRSTTYSFRTHPHEVSVDVVLTSGHLRVHPSQISNKNYKEDVQTLLCSLHDYPATVHASDFEYTSCDGIAHDVHFSTRTPHLFWSRVGYSSALLP